MVFPGLHARTPLAMVISLPRTLGQEWLRLAVSVVTSEQRAALLRPEARAARRAGGLVRRSMNGDVTLGAS